MGEEDDEAATTSPHCTIQIHNGRLILRPGSAKWPDDDSMRHGERIESRRSAPRPRIRYESNICTLDVAEEMEGNYATADMMS